MNEDFYRKLSEITGGFDIVNNNLNYNNTSIGKALVTMSGSNSFLNSDLYKTGNKANNLLAPSIIELTKSLKSLKNLDYQLSVPKTNLSSLISANASNIYSYPWKQDFPEISYDFSSIKSSMKILGSFQSQLNIFSDKNLKLNLKDNTITDGLSVAMAIDFNNLKNSPNFEAEKETIKEIIVTTNQFIENIDDDTNQVFEKLNEYLIFLFSGITGNNTRKFLRDLMINLTSAYLISILVPTASATNIANQTINNSPTTINQNGVTINQTVNVNQTIIINNGVAVPSEFVLNGKYIASANKFIRNDKSKNAKVIATLLAGTQITILKKYRIWVVVSYLDTNNEVVIGYTTTENLM